MVRATGLPVPIPFPLQPISIHNIPTCPAEAHMARPTPQMCMTDHLPSIHNIAAPKLCPPTPRTCTILHHPPIFNNNKSMPGVFPPIPHPTQIRTPLLPTSIHSIPGVLITHMVRTSVFPRRVRTRINEYRPQERRLNLPTSQTRRHLRTSSIRILHICRDAAPRIRMHGRRRTGNYNQIIVSLLTNVTNSPSWS
jgi:hypothetical protein